MTTSMPVSRDERAILRALTHRIHNDLVSSINIVSADAVRADNPEVKAALGNVVELLEQHAEIQRLLAMPDGGGLVDAAECIRKLGLASSPSLKPMGIRLTLAADPLPLEAQRCWRLALAIHELLTNASRHAYFDCRVGAIKIKLSLAQNVVNCIVADNGSRSTRLKPAPGLQMVTDLVNGLGGRIDYAFGTQFSSCLLVFPLTVEERRANRTVASRRARGSLKRKAMPPQSWPRAAPAQSARARDIPETVTTAAARLRNQMEGAYVEVLGSASVDERRPTRASSNR